MTVLKVTNKVLSNEIPWLRSRDLNVCYIFFGALLMFLSRQSLLADPLEETDFSSSEHFVLSKAIVFSHRNLLLWL